MSSAQSHAIKELCPTSQEDGSPVPPNTKAEPAVSTAVVSEASNATRPSKPKSVLVITTLAGMSFLNTMGTGVLIGALPRIADELGLEEGFLLWPASVYALAAGCLLLIFGTVADAVGAKLVWITGCGLYVGFTLAVGLARTALQLILFRTFQGVAIAMCLPTAVGLITHTFPQGHWRNIAFACNGMGQPLGYSLGLILGGIFTDTIGWRWSYYMSAIINGLLTLAAIFVLPTIRSPSTKSMSRRLIEDIDWIGACILSAALGVLLYVLAVTTSSYRSITTARNIALLVISLILLMCFPVWMRVQVKRGKPALIPNKLWTNAAFTSTCVATFFSWASLNAIQYFSTLFFQRVQHLSALESAIRFLPQVIVGTLTNILTGLLVSRINVYILLVISAVITSIAPVLMATIAASNSYWYAAFFAMILSPVNPDILFTVSNLIISSAFPTDVQSLAGGVFNEVAQFGNSVGLAVTAAIAASVTEHTIASGRNSRADTQNLSESASAAELMDGYRAAFWTMFAATVVVIAVVGGGLRKCGHVGREGT